MSNILEQYQKQLLEEKKLEEAEPKDGEDKTEYQKEVDKKVKEMKLSDPNDMDNILRKFSEEYPKVHEEDIPNTDEDVRLVVRHAYCPKCGKEVMSKQPLMLNPYTGMRICKYECSCGWKANLDHAYPSVRYVNKDGKEIKCFAE